MDVIKAECGLEISVIVSIFKLDNGFWIEAKLKTSEVFCYTRRSSLVSWKNRDNFSKIYTSAPHNWNTIWLVSQKGLGKNILLQPISEMKV
jgi:hypothetical protein